LQNQLNDEKAKINIRSNDNAIAKVLANDYKYITEKVEKILKQNKDLLEKNKELKIL
jgi:hypothetical protein